MNRHVSFQLKLKALFANISIQFFAAIFALDIFFWEKLPSYLAWGVFIFIGYLCYLHFWGSYNFIQLLKRGRFAELEVLETRKKHGGSHFHIFYLHHYQFETEDGELIKDSMHSDTYKFQGKATELLYLPDKPKCHYTLLSLERAGFKVEENKISYFTEFEIAEIVLGRSNFFIYLGVILPLTTFVYFVIKLLGMF